MMQPKQPLVSVVIATYNRADILPYAIRSVLLTAGLDLEVIVVGDGCSDQTAEALSAIGDSRVRYVNLPQNWGEQSVPSNEGILQSRGEFVAFLNHDDLFLPWHLPDLLALHCDGADVTWSPYIIVYPAPSGADRVRHSRYVLAGVTPTTDFDPVVFAIASATCYRKSVLEDVGGWTRASQTILSPSQDLLFKAYKAGFKIRRTDRPSVLVPFSGDRKNSYVNLSAEEHRCFYELVRGGDERLFPELLRASVHDAAKTARTSVARFALRRLHRHVSSFALRFGIHPHAPRMWLRYRKRGGFVNYVRQETGLPAVDFRARERERGKRS